MRGSTGTRRAPSCAAAKAARAAAAHGTGGPGGGSVDEIQKRLTAVETTQAETKIILQGVVTKAEFEQFRGEVLAAFEKLEARLVAMFEKLSGRIGAIEVQLPHLATKADINSVRVEIANLHAAMIKWVVGTMISGMAAAMLLRSYLARSGCARVHAIQARRAYSAARVPESADAGASS